MKGGPPLIVTRPEPGNTATTLRARAMGFEVHAMPLFAARPVDWRAPAAQVFDALLLTSAFAAREAGSEIARLARSAEHTSELQSLMRISSAAICSTKKSSNER